MVAGYGPLAAGALNGNYTLDNGMIGTWTCEGRVVGSEGKLQDLPC
jgi:hypothetical protein